MSSLISRDLASIWHPCSQMQDYENFAPLIVKQARGCHLQLEDGRQILDAISSWWCKPLGHAHPVLKAALLEQAERFEHIMLANTSNETIVNLSEKLSQLMPSLNKVFYASDGACATEIALKLSIHSRQLMGQAEKKDIICLQNGYHGETLGALSVSDIGIYREPYDALLFPCHVIDNVPYLNHCEDPLWHDCETAWQLIEKQLAPLANTASALIFEPILQAASQMKIYSANFMKRLAKWCQEHDVHLIADEIMTGFGRTGQPLACQHAGIEPDFLCVGKNLSGGYLPISAVLTKQTIYDLFYDKYESGKSFLHSHTFAGNALAANVALAFLNVLEQENWYQQIPIKAQKLQSAFVDAAEESGLLQNIRHIGMVVAGDITTENPRPAIEILKAATKFGALIRPIGKTLYWVPPYIINNQEIEQLRLITVQSLQHCRQQGTI